MTVEVTRARAEDAAAISALNAHVQGVHAGALPFRFKPAGPDVFPAAEVLALMQRPETRMKLARVDGVPAGYAYAEVMRRPETAATHAFGVVYVHHLSVDPAFRRGGVGSALMQAVRDEGAREGIARLAPDVWSFNEAAQRFFAAQGLVAFNVRMWTAQGLGRIGSCATGHRYFADKMLEGTV